MITITRKPISKITGDLANESRFTSAHQPVEFELQRKDLLVNSITKSVNSNGRLIAKVNVGSTSGLNLSPGQNVKYTCGTGGSRSYNLVILRVQFGFLLFDITDVYGNGSINRTEAIIIVNRKGYYIETFVYCATKNLAFELIGVLRSITDVFGKANINVQKLLSSSVTNENNGTYTSINEAITNQGKPFNIKSREVYEGFIGEFTSLLTTDNLYFVNGSKQIQDNNGYNFGEFVPSLNDARVNKAKFLSVFEKPTYFNNYPFDISFIYSDLLLNKQLSRVENSKNVNNVAGGDQMAIMLVNGRGFVNRLMLSGSFTFAEKSVDVYIDAGTNTTQTGTTGRTGGTTLTDVGTVFNPLESAVKHSLNDISNWAEVFNQGNTTQINYDQLNRQRRSEMLRYNDLFE